MEILKKVQQKVEEMHSEIVMGVYRNMVRSHNDFCGCNYCQILKQYVTQKIHTHRIIKRAEDVYEWTNMREVIETDALVEHSKRICRMLKQEKDKLKLLNL